MAYWRPLGAWAKLKTDEEMACLRRLRTWRTPIYAIVRAGGKQYRVEPDQTLDVDRIQADVGSTVDFGVLLVGGNGEVSIGTPEVDKAKVVAEVIEHGRDRKILVFKYKNKTRYRRRHGHRQDYTRLQIKEIVTAEGTFTEAGEKPKSAAPKRRRKTKAKAKPVAEETPTTEAAAVEAAPEAEAPAAETEAKPKRASRTTAKKAITKRPSKAKAKAAEPKTEDAPPPEPEAKEEPKSEEPTQPAPEAKEEPKADDAPQPAPEAKEQPEETE